MTATRRVFLDQLSRIPPNREIAPASHALAVARAVHLFAANSTYAPGSGPATRTSPSALAEEATLFHALDAVPPGPWWTRGAELVRPQRLVRDLPAHDWLGVPLRQGGPLATTGPLGRAQAVGLVLQEDGPLWEEYVVQTLAPSSGAPRVLEVRSSEDWLELVTS